MSRREVQIWDNDSSSDEEDTHKSQLRQQEDSEPSREVPVRPTRSLELKVIAFMIIALLYCLITALTLPNSPQAEETFLDDLKMIVEPSQNPVLAGSPDYYTEKPYIEFVEKWYGTSIVISSSKDEDFNVEKQEEGEKPTIEKNQISQVKMSELLHEQLDGRVAAEGYRHIDEYKPYPQLPFCLVVMARDEGEVFKIAKSLALLKYSNYRLIFAISKGKNLVDQILKNVVFWNGEVSTYAQLKEVTDQNCLLQSLIFPVTYQLKTYSLSNLNEIFQSYSAWSVYSTSNGRVQILSFYKRVLDMIESNDFDSTNKGYLKNPDMDFLAIPFLELTKYHSYEISSDIIAEEGQKESLISPMINSKAGYTRTSYQPLLKLYQTSNTNLENEFKIKKEMMEREDGQRAKEQYLNKEKLLRLVEYENLPYLPPTHSLNTRESTDLQRLFKLSEVSEELPLCVTVISQNNKEGKRYEKSILSIIQQEYSNFHIVFIDDNSQDDTLKLTMEIMNKRGVLASEVTFVRNSLPKHSAYNILHAAHDYCNPEDIQVIVEGDDYLVGRKVFKLLNTVYQRNKDMWIVYGASVDNQYNYGNSRPVISDSQLLTSENERVSNQFLGRLSSWRVKLLNKIPLENFKYLDGSWMGATYDIAMQYPLFEAATAKHIKYVPALVYLSVNHRTRGYIANQASVNKKDLRETILPGSPLAPILSLEYDEQSRMVSSKAKQEFKEDGQDYKEVTYGDL